MSDQAGAHGAGLSSGGKGARGRPGEILADLVDRRAAHGEGRRAGLGGLGRDGVRFSERHRSAGRSVGAVVMGPAGDVVAHRHGVSLAAPVAWAQAETGAFFVLVG